MANFIEYSFSMHKNNVFNQVIIHLFKNLNIQNLKHILILIAPQFLFGFHLFSLKNEFVIAMVKLSKIHKNNSFINKLF